MQIIARGNTLVHMLNGRVVTVVVDDDPSASDVTQAMVSEYRKTTKQ